MDLFNWALTVSRKRLKPASLATYSSLYSGYEARLGTLADGCGPSRPGQESAEQMVRALSANGDYLTQKRTLALLRWIYKTLNEAGHELVDQTAEIERLYLADHRTAHRSLDKTWQSRLIAAAAEQAKGWKSARLVAIAHVLCDAALKTAELIELKTVDLTGSPTLDLHVRSGGETRSLPLTPETSAALRAWLAAHPAPLSPYLFVRDATGQPMDSTTLWRQIGRMKKAAGLDQGPHKGTGAIRASKARELTQQGVATSDIARFLGHRFESSTGELLDRTR